MSPGLRDAGHRVGGLDGCRAGWVLAALGPEGLEVRVVPTFAEVVAEVDDGTLAALAVDMPIGLPDHDGPRAADRQARRRLGARRSSVFPTPVRATLGALDYADALAISRQVSGKGLSKQAFNLLARIAEVDRIMTPAHQDRVFECHPELAFAQLAGVPAAPTPSTRRRASTSASTCWPGPLVGRRAPGLAEAAGAPGRGAGADDVVDAVAIALVAEAVAAGSDEVERLGDGARDRRGLRMEIVADKIARARRVRTRRFRCND